MNQIRVLDRRTAELIAAGEVIERPASVVKELVENAIDAGATKIAVQLEGGGVGSIVVRDNGSGIPKEQVPTAFLRHATSKIRTPDDLNAIFTMGFRGEALASIAAVSKVTLQTRTEEEQVGTLLYMEGGVNPTLEDAGCPVGTEIRVEQLFYNTPARLKFLKTDVSEGNAVASYIEKLAISRPDIAFTLNREGREVLRTAGDGDLKACLWAVCGKEFASRLLPLDAVEGGIRVRGYVSEPAAAKSRRAMQLFYVNGRYFQSRACQAVLEEGMKGSLMSGLHPGCAVFIDLPADQVDVNVHPAKLEVRFAQERSVYRVIHMAVKQALMAAQSDPFAAYQSKGVKKPAPLPEKEIQTKLPLQTKAEEKKPSVGSSGVYLERLRQVFAPEEKPSQTAQKSADEKETMLGSELFAPAKKEEVLLFRASDEKEDADFQPSERKTEKQTLWQAFEKDPEKAAAQEPKQESAEFMASQTEIFQAKMPKEAPSFEEVPEEMPEETIEETPEFRLLGCFAKTYLLAEMQGALLVVDQHAAHEKILFEDLKKRRENESQMLLEPLVLELSALESDALLRQESRLEDLGFSLEEFGPGSLLVRRIPAVLRPEKAQEALYEMAETFATTGVAQSGAKALDWIYHSVACRGAVKAGDSLSAPEQEMLIGRVLSDPNIRHCPHGRPVYFLLEKDEMEKRFGRI